MASSSCSTTTTEFPNHAAASGFQGAVVVRWYGQWMVHQAQHSCKPNLFASQPDALALPARKCADAPTDSYSNPTFCRNPSRSLISRRMRRAISFWFLFRVVWSLVNHSPHASMNIRDHQYVCRPARPALLVSNGCAAGIAAGNGLILG